MQERLEPEGDAKYAPHTLQKVAAGGILLLVLLTFATVNIQSIAFVTSTWLSSAVLPAVLIDLTNEEREGEDLRPLVRNSILDEAARLKAEDMAEYEYFSHDSPSGVTPWYWFERAGYHYAYAGENLAVHFSDSDEVVDAWMRSPGHRANIMHALYTEIGIGTAKGTYKGAPTIFVVQLFGRPLSPEEKVKVADLESSSNQTVTDITPPILGASVVEVEAVSEIPIDSLETASEMTLDEDEEGVADSSAEPIPADPEPVFAAAPNEPQTLRLTIPDIATVSPFVARGVLTLPIGESGGNTAQVRESHILSQFSVRPHALMMGVYIALSFSVLLILAISIVREWRRRHALHVAYGFGLIAVMWGAFYIHVTLLSGVLIV